MKPSLNIGPLNIGMISFAFHRTNGQGLVNCEIATAALARGHRVTLFCEEVDPDLAAMPGVEVVKLTAGKLPSQLLRDQALALQATLAVAKRRHRLDLVVTNGFCMWGGSDVNAVHFLHRSWARSPNHPWRLKRTPDSAYRWLYSLANCWFEHHSFKRSRHIVAVSEPLRREVIELGLAPDRVSTIHNGVDLARFRPGPPERERFGLPSCVPTGIFVGDIQTSRKNLDSVLKALAHVPGVHLAIVGKAEGSMFPAMAERLGVAERCHFIGFLKPDDVAAAFRSTDFFIFPSRYETSGLVLLEAAATGLPVITARSVGGAGIFAPDGALIADDPEDVVWLTNAMIRLRDDPRLAADLARAAQAIAERQTWSAATARYLDLFERLADSHSPESSAIDLRLSKGA
jgi:glycosyltransferase involved in cell wall biosynthesis